MAEEVTQRAGLIWPMTVNKDESPEHGNLTFGRNLDQLSYYKLINNDRYMECIRYLGGQ
jgi:hypothetical protein